MLRSRPRTRRRAPGEDRTDGVDRAGAEQEPNGTMKARAAPVYDGADYAAARTSCAAGCEGTAGSPASAGGPGSTRGAAGTRRSLNASTGRSTSTVAVTPTTTAAPYFASCARGAVDP